MNTPESQPSTPESFKEVEITIEDPKMDKGFFVSFNCDDKEMCKHYNRALDKVLTAHNMRPFHQSGSFEGKGYQAWELWVSTNRQALEALIPEIQEQAKADYDLWKSME